MVFDIATCREDNMARLFHKAYSNRSIIYPGNGGITPKGRINPNRAKKIKAIKDFLFRYQAFYKETGQALKIPDEYKKYFNCLKFRFRMEKDNIENMLKLIKHRHFK